MDSLFPSRLDENISSDAPVRLANQLVDEFDIIIKASALAGFKARIAFANHINLALAAHHLAIAVARLCAFQ